MWISPEFKVYLIREFQRLKTEEQKQTDWSAKRELSKINYRIHTDAIRQHLIPDEVTQAQASVIYADKAIGTTLGIIGLSTNFANSHAPSPMPTCTNISISLPLRTWTKATGHLWDNMAHTGLPHHKTEIPRHGFGIVAGKSDICI